MTSITSGNLFIIAPPHAAPRPFRPHRHRMLSAHILPGLFRTIGLPSRGRPFLRPSGQFRHRDEEFVGWCQWVSLSAFLVGKASARNEETRRNLESPLSAGQ